VTAPVQSAGATAAGPAPARLRLTGVVKTFPGVRALDGVDFELRPGEVHALFGENGAGKSTIINIIAGNFAPDAGRYEYEGAQVQQLTPHKARVLGISAVFQEFSLVPELSVEQNIFLGREPARAGFVDRARMRSRTRDVLQRLGFDIAPQARVSGLSRARRQMVEIAKAVLDEVKVLILDEPTASLTDAESERLFALIGELRAQGVAIIYVSHRMREIARIADRITVLRDGRHIATVNSRDVRDADLIELMTGRKIDILFPHIAHAPGARVLATEGLSLASGAVRDASIEVRAGEIVGIAGLAGCGKSELVRAIFGLEEISGGRIALDGQPLGRCSPAASLRAGICYFPSDRNTEGLALVRPIRENASMAALDEPEFARGGMLRLAS
jgi:ribose transport system ATP-binding protein